MTSATLHGRPHQRARKRTMPAPGRAHMEWGTGRTMHIFPSARKEPWHKAVDGGVEQDCPGAATSSRGSVRASDSDSRSAPENSNVAFGISFISETWG